MNSYTNVAKAVFFFDGDENADEYQTTIIEYKKSLWLVATWISNTEQNMRIPDRIVPLDLFHPAPLLDGEIRLGRLVPKALLTVDCPTELLLLFFVDTLSIPVQSHLSDASFH